MAPDKPFQDGKGLRVGQLRDRDIPKLSPPNGVPRAVIVEADDRIVGAWIDKGRHAGDAMTLAGEKVPPSEEFLSQFVDDNSPLELEPKEMEAEDVIRTYWAAVDSGYDARAHACETKATLFGYLLQQHGRQPSRQRELRALLAPRGR